MFDPEVDLILHISRGSGNLKQMIKSIAALSIIPVIGLIENMSYFTPKELPENKYYIFGNSGVKNLSEKMNIEFLGEIPLVQSVREAADAGRPAVLQDNTAISNTFMKLAEKIDDQIKKRNVNLPPTKKVDITHQKGCS